MSWEAALYWGTAACGCFSRVYSCAEDGSQGREVLGRGACEFYCRRAPRAALAPSPSGPADLFTCTGLTQGNGVFVNLHLLFL